MSVTTLCRDCKFADFKDNKQVGCWKQRLSKFEEIGVKTELVEEGDKQYYSIGELCNYCVNRDSYDKTDKPETRLYEMTRFRVDWIVVDDVNDDYATTYNKVLLILHHAIYDSLRPDRVIFVMSNNDKLTNTQRYELYAMINDMLSGTKIVPSIAFAVEPRSYWDNISSVLHNVKSEYFTIWESGYNIPHNFNANLDKMINTELRDFILFCGLNDKNGITCKSSALSYLSYHKLENLVEAIKDDFKEADKYQIRKHIIEKEEIYGPEYSSC